MPRLPKAPGGPPVASAASAAAWQVPADAYGSQILYRVTVSGAEGEGSLKLTLRLASPDRYQVQAVDPLGRALWGLDVEGDRGLWLDHRARRYCRLTGSLDLAFLPLGPLSLAALPPLLLGRLPVAPADAAGVTRQPATGRGAEGLMELGYADAAGRRWSALAREGRPVSWGLWSAPPPLPATPPATAATPETATPILSWVSSGGWSVLSDRRKGAQVRWRQALREALRPFAALSPPADYREGSCGGNPPAAAGMRQSFDSLRQRL
jgi:hypothetical protein